MLKKFLTSKLSGDALGVAVSIADHSGPDQMPDTWRSLDPLEIVARECIDVWRGFGHWVASHPGNKYRDSYSSNEVVEIRDADASIGETPIQAAMRCYVKYKLGDTVELPCASED